MSSPTPLLRGGYPTNGLNSKFSLDPLVGSQEAARQHGRLLHPKARPGLVAIAKRDPAAANPKDRWKQCSVKVSQLAHVLGEYAGK